MKHCEECYYCFETSKEKITTNVLSIKQTEEILEVQEKLFLNSYFNSEILQEMKTKFRGTNSFSKTLVYCLNKVLRSHDRYIPLSVLCRVNNVMEEEYKHFVRHNNLTKGECLKNLSIQAYVKYMCNQLGLKFKEEKVISKISAKIYESLWSLHPIAIVGSVIFLKNFNDYNGLIELCNAGGVTNQTLKSCISKVKGRMGYI